MAATNGPTFRCRGVYLQKLSIILRQKRGSDYWPKHRCKGICFQELSGKSRATITGQNFFAGGSVFKSFRARAGQRLLAKASVRRICFQKLSGQSVTGTTGQTFCAGGSVFKSFRARAGQRLRAKTSLQWDLFSQAFGQERGKDYWPKLLCRGICFQQLSGKSGATITGKNFAAGGSVFKSFRARASRGLLAKASVQGDLFSKAFGQEQGNDYWQKLRCRVCFQKLSGKSVTGITGQNFDAGGSAFQDCRRRACQGLLAKTSLQGDLFSKAFGQEPDNDYGQKLRCSGICFHKLSGKSVTGITGQSFCAGGSVFQSFRARASRGLLAKTFLQGYLFSTAFGQEQGNDYWQKLRCRGICVQKLSGKSVTEITGQSFCAGGSVFKSFRARAGQRLLVKISVQGDLFSKMFG